MARGIDLRWVVGRLGDVGIASCAALLAFAAAPARTVELPGGASAELAWEPASGAVSAYVVFVSRDGGPYRSEQYTPLPRARVTGRAGETLRVRVRAYGVDGDHTLTSPASAPSEPIHFLPAASLPSAAAALPAKLDADAPPASRLAPPARLPSPADGIRRIPGFQFVPPLRVEASGDFDGDGDLDLVATLGSWHHPMALFLEDGSLEHAVCLPPLEDASGALAADFDGDGKAELAVRTPRELRVLHLERSGRLTELRRESVPAGAVVVAADLDGDGRATLVVYDSTTGRLSERLAAHDADFGSIRPLHALLAGDFDGDGRDDLWVQAAPGPDAELWLMDGKGGFRVAPVHLGRRIEAAVAADVNGDGRADLAGYDAASDELVAWLLDGGRVIGERKLASGPVESVRSGDVDGDGLDDLLLRAPDGDTSALVLSR